MTKIDSRGSQYVTARLFDDVFVPESSPAVSKITRSRAEARVNGRIR